jgi:hypothetical protein
MNFFIASTQSEKERKEKKERKKERKVISSQITSNHDTHVIQRERECQDLR